MSILESVFRRIIIRNVDKAITGTAKSLVNSAGQTYSQQAVLPTVGRLIWNVFAFIVLVFGLSAILLGIGTELAYVIPFLFIWRVIRPLTQNYTYDYKSVAITKSDRRYSSGSRTIGYKYVKDKDAKIIYTDGQTKISKIEGAFKLIVFIASLLFIYNTTSTPKFKVENMSYADKVKILKQGDTLFTNSPKIDFFARYKDDFRKNEVIVESGKDSVSIAGVFIKVDSAADRYGKYERYFELKPIKEPKYDDPILYEPKDRVGKTWYVDPSDINVGQRKIKKSE